MRVRVFKIEWGDGQVEWMAGPHAIHAECEAIYETEHATITEYEGELTVGEDVER